MVLSHFRVTSSCCCSPFLLPGWAGWRGPPEVQWGKEQANTSSYCPCLLLAQPGLLQVGDRLFNKIPSFKSDPPTDL